MERKTLTVLIPVLTALLLMPGLLAAADEQTQAKPVNHPGMRLKPVVVKDEQMNDIEAFRLLVPATWEHRGGIYWFHDRVFLAAAAMQFWNPAGPEGLQMYPMVTYTWAEKGIWNFPPGSNYLGNIVAQPVTPEDYVKSVVWPQFRDGIEGEVIDVKPLDDVAKTLAKQLAEPTMRNQVRAARIRVRYSHEGKAYDEDFYCAMSYMTGDLLPGTTFWQPVRLYSFRAAKGELDANANLLHTIVSSVRINPRWHAGFMQVRAMFFNNQRQAIRSAGELSKLIAKTSEEIREINTEAWKNRQRTEDRLNRQFSNVIRGVDDYRNPYTDEHIQLPNTQKQTWVSAQGEYLLSDDVNYNPNVGDTTEWQQITPVELPE